MTLDDYRILDGLRGTELTPADEFLLNQARAKPRKIRSIILSALCELVVHEEAEDFMDLWVRSKA